MHQQRSFAQWREAYSCVGLQSGGCVQGKAMALWDVTQTRQQRPELPAVTIIWHASKYKAQVEFVYLALAHRPGASYYWRRRSLLLWLCDVFWAQLTPLFVDPAQALWALYCLRLWRCELDSWVQLSCSFCHTAHAVQESLYTDLMHSFAFKLAIRALPLSIDAMWRSYNGTP